MQQKRLLVTLGCTVCVTAAMLAQQDWKTYGNDPGHARFSTLTQITPQNVTRLTKAWEFDTRTPGRKWQNTAVVINNILYITLQNGGVVALEPETGRELWRFETPVRGRSVRAIAYWPGDDDTAPRLLYGANDKLIELDPITGRPIESFGNKGVLDVHPGQPAGAATAARAGAERQRRRRAARRPRRARAAVEADVATAAGAVSSAPSAADSRSPRRRPSTRTWRLSAAPKARTRWSARPAIRRRST